MSQYTQTNIDRIVAGADRLATVGPDPVVSDTQRRQELEARARQREQELDSAFAGVIGNTSIGYLVRQFALSGYDEDPTFQLTDRVLDELSDGIDPHLIPRLGDARSWEHANAIRAQLLLMTDHRQALSEAGFGMKALNAATQVTDPGVLALGVVTGGVANAYVARAGIQATLGRLAVRGLITGAGFAGYEEWKSRQDPSITSVDVLAAGLSGFGMTALGGATEGRLTSALAAGAGGALPPAAIQATANAFREEDQRRAVLWDGATNFLLGAGLSALMHSNTASDRVDQAARRMRRDVEYDAVVESGIKLTPEGETYFKDQINQAARVEALTATALGELRADNVVATPLPRMAGEVDALFGTARDRLAAFPDDHRLNRSEVDAVLEGTGYRAGNQGFPSVDEMRGYLNELWAESHLALQARLSTPESMVIGRGQPQGTLLGGRFTLDDALAEVIDRSNIITTAPKAAMGAAAAGELTTPPEAPVKQWDDFDASGITDAKPSRPMWAPRFDMPGMVGDSEVSSIRLAANIFGKDPLPKADGTPSFYSAPEVASDWTAATRGKLLTGMDVIFADYRKAGGTMSRPEFNEAATRAWRRAGTTQATTDPHLARAAALGSELIEEVLGRATRHGVPGFEKVEHRANYVGRLWRQDIIDEVGSRVDKAGSNVGQDILRRLIGGSILRGEWDLTPKQADAIARAVIRNGGKTRRNELDRGTMFRNNPEVLEDALRNSVPDITPEQIADIVKQLQPKGDGATPSRGKRRVDLDETFSIDTPDGPLSIEDLLENDFESLVTRYAHQLHGAAALHEGLARFGTPEAPITSIDGLLRKLENDAVNAGLKEHQYLPDIGRIEVMAKITAGIPLSEDRLTSRILRTIQNLNFVRLMSNIGTGAQNFAEITHGLTEGGLRAATKQMPVLGELFKRGAEGQLDNRLLREMEIIGLGLDRLNHRITPRTAGDDPILEHTTKAEYLSARAARLAGDVSMQSYGQVAIARINASIIAQAWADIAVSGKYPTAKRLAGFGLTEEMAKRVTDQIREHATIAKGGRLESINFEAWRDVEAAMSFRNALSKYTRRVALQTNATELSQWMTTEGGRLVLQLRKFLVGSWTNKLLFTAYMRDGIAARSLMTGVVGAGLVYVARTYADSIGKPDGDKYRRERLAPERIAAASFGRSAFSSLLPTIVDTGADLVGRPRPFQYSRTTGLSNSALFGNPTVDWARSAYQVPRAIIGPLWEDYDLSKQDVSNLTNGLWIPNILGLRNIIDQLSADLPAQSRPGR